MRLTFSCLMPVLGLSSTVLAGNAQVYLSGDSVSSHAGECETGPVSPSTARLIFAQRLGLSQFHSLNDADDSALQAVNRFGGTSPSVFEGESTASPSRLRALIIIEGVDNTAEFLSTREHHLTFKASDPPPSSANEVLLQDFARQAQYLQELTVNRKVDALRQLRALESKLESVKGFGDIQYIIYGASVLVHSKALEAIAKMHGTPSPAYKAAAATICESLDSILSTASGDELDVTIALFPSQRSGLRIWKTADSSYGSYSTPPLLSLERRQYSKKDSSDSLASTKTSTKATASSSATPVKPPGILPSCFSSVSSCDSATNSCSGQGHCDLKYKYTDGDDATSCYSCMCQNQTRTNKDGSKKTIIWSGPACNKIDVSAEFWLLGGFTVALVSLVSWGVGMLYSMGQEDLPSVIGAGVSGPRAK